MLSPIPNACSQAPTHITPPTGAFEVYDFDASTNTAALVGSYGDDGTAAHKAMRRAGNSACIARGGVATTLKGTTPPSHGVRMKAAVKLTWTLAQREPAPVTPRPVEPAAAPVAPSTIDAEEPMPTPAAPATCSRSDCNDPVAGARGCAPVMVPFCRKHRTAAMAMRVQYKLTDEEAAQRCIANGSASPPPKVSATKPAAPKKAAPAPKPRVVNRPVSPESSPAVVEAPVSDFAAKVRAELARVEAVLLEKNAAYGNSALEPVRVFSRATPIEQLLVRIDDKLSRLARGSDAGEDVELDLVGYLVLLRIARRA